MSWTISHRYLLDIDHCKNYHFLTYQRKFLILVSYRQIRVVNKSGNMTPRSVTLFRSFYVLPLLTFPSSFLTETVIFDRNKSHCKTKNIGFYGYVKPPPPILTRYGLKTTEIEQKTVAHQTLPIKISV